MSGAAQRFDGTAALEFDGAGSAAVEAPVTEAPLKQAVAERLAAHRQKREAQQRQQAEIQARQAAGTPSQHAGARVREAVAARYQQTQTYREFLALEADRALKQAQAEAEVAARKAVAVAEAKSQLMDEIAQWSSTATHDEMVREIVIEEQRTEMRGELAHALADIAMGAQELIREVEFEEAQRHSSVAPGGSSAAAGAGLSIQLVDDVALPAVPSMVRPHLYEEDMRDELAALEDEIAFRLAPELGEYVIDSQPLPANIIEFPRQLVAPKKARPRLAEGPLREDAPTEPQLRIFEVEAEQISSEPAYTVTAAPDWQSLKLEANTEAVVSAPQHAQTQFTLQPQVAPMERRLMAAAVDVICVGAATAAFVAVAVEIAGQRVEMMPKPLAFGSLAAVFVMLFAAYQVLFFSLSGDTAGMRYARISLCTFGDRNPTRKEMRRRVFATLLAACPVAIGLAWSFLDDEGLGWHDRMSRMYQRAY